MGSVRLRGRVHWVRYYRNGRRHEESSGSRKRSDAERLLKLREGDVARGVPITPKVGQLRYDEAADDVLTDYRVNGKRTLVDARRRHEKHLQPFFGGRRMASISTPDVRSYTSNRLDAGASPGGINRELTLLKRAFSLAIQAGKLLAKPHIPLLRENNVRKGFFEPDEIGAVLRNLPQNLAVLVRFAYITGWRVPSEIQSLQWRQVDCNVGEVRLDPGTTKNGEGRTFPFTDELWEILRGQKAVCDELQRGSGTICPWVFHRNGRPIKSFRVAWQNACLQAGCPGRLLHDLRRTAVRNMVRSGISEPVAMRLTGHKTRSVFDRYNIVSRGDLKAAADRLNTARSRELAKPLEGRRRQTLK